MYIEGLWWKSIVLPAALGTLGVILFGAVTSIRSCGNVSPCTESSTIISSGASRECDVGGRLSSVVISEATPSAEARVEVRCFCDRVPDVDAGRR